MTFHDEDGEVLMEITIKTMDEVRDARVRIEITADDITMTPEKADRILDQADRAGKVPALEQQVRELKAWIEAHQDTISNERDRANENLAWAQRAERNLATSESARQAMVKQAGLDKRKIADLDALLDKTDRKLEESNGLLIAAGNKLEQIRKMLGAATTYELSEVADRVMTLIEEA